jgi:2-oxoglutarate/2-oxoacid ferredoxin oxidoreductase subunit beta
LLHEVGFVPFYEQISVNYEPGSVRIIELHDGSHISLRKLENEYDPTDKAQSLHTLRESASNHEFLTGLLYYEAGKPDFTGVLRIHKEPLASLPAELIRPSREVLTKILEDFK